MYKSNATHQKKFIDTFAASSADEFTKLFDLPALWKEIAYHLFRLHRLHNGKIFPSNETLAKHCNCSGRTIQRVKAWLEKNELITVEQRFAKVGGIVRQLTSVIKLAKKMIDFLPKQAKKKPDREGQRKVTLNQLWADPTAVVGNAKPIEAGEWLLYWREKFSGSTTKTIEQWRSLFAGWRSRSLAAPAMNFATSEWAKSV